MKIHFIRNATLIIETDKHHILLDPMLGPVATLPPLAFLRHKARRNPIAAMPPNTAEKLAMVTTAVITHCRLGHYDHLDKTGWKFLAKRQITTYCNQADVPYLQKRKIATRPLQANQPHSFLDGRITPFPTQHGYGLIGKMMGPGFGYLIELPGEPTLYLSGDTVLTATVHHVLTEYKPDIAVLAAGSASLDIGKPILMPMSELVEFVRLAPGQVIATHMEALNHCPTTRTELQTAVAEAGLSAKLNIPADGETLEFSTKKNSE